MFNLLHTFNPNPILITFDPIKVYWYGLFIVLGVLLAIMTTLKLASFYKVEKNKIIDLGFNKLNPKNVKIFYKEKEFDITDIINKVKHNTFRLS